MIREATLLDAPAITKIYNHYVEHSGATMEYETVSSSFYEDKIKKTLDSEQFWLVAEKDGEIIGYAYSRIWNPRDGYRFTCEVSIYISPTVITKGWGTKLYTALFNKLKEAGMLVIIAVITLPNEASIALHEKFGMKKVAHFPKMGIKFDRWLDVGYWQVNLN
ncbi:MAG: N-acetyltransferase [Balneola sp.]|nr:MAG: N-acetyltransferase [Balneola sp.]